MAYNEELAQRVRQVAQDYPLREKKMFGGISFFLNGNMTCGVIGEELIVRVGPDGFGEAMQRPGAHVFDFTGKPMAGWVKVVPESTQRDEDLQEWVSLGITYAATLPAK
jgi:TfoX/Sxy family transcriptional regulator of competence genes